MVEADDEAMAVREQRGQRSRSSAHCRRKRASPLRSTTHRSQRRRRRRRPCSSNSRRSGRYSGQGPGVDEKLVGSLPQSSF